MATEANIQRCARVIGDGEFALPVAGAAEHQTDLEILAGGRSEEGALRLCAALLQPKPHNLGGRKVAVIVHSCTVGYLTADTERVFLVALQEGGFANAACEAVIFGGRHHEGEADSDFGIKLNATLPFELIDPVTRARAADGPGRAQVWTSAPPQTPRATVPEPAPGEPLPHGAHTHVFRARAPGRGIFGRLVLVLLVLFNLAMAGWMLTYWTGIFELADAVFSGGEWEAKFRGLLGTELILAIWIAGAVVLGLAAYATRGHTVVVAEAIDDPASPTA